jgi:hypothetical protein
LDCGSEKLFGEVLNVVDGSGKTVEHVDVLDAFIKSPYRGLLFQTPSGDRCTPLHMTSATRIPADMAAALPGIEAGDFLVSMRDISAIGIIGKNGKEFKSLFRGSWIRQYSVLPWKGSKVLLLDNLGGGNDGGPSRLLDVDLATGEERTLFPHKYQGEAFSFLNGTIDLSQDRERAFISFPEEGTAYEFVLDKGIPLTKILSLHDLHTVLAYTDVVALQSKAALLPNYAVLYVPKSAPFP